MALQDYCTKMGIMGFNTGRLPPAVALAMLKKQMGDYANVPLEERIPEGYEKCGTRPVSNPSYPFSPVTQAKVILHG